MDCNIFVLTLLSTFLLTCAQETGSGPNSSDMTPSPIQQPALASPIPSTRPRYRMSLANIYKAKEIDYDEENPVDMMKMPLDKAGEMKEDAMNMMKMPLDKAGEMKEDAMNMKMPLDKAGEMKEDAMNMMKMPLDKAGEMKESAMNMMKMPLDKAGEMKENAMNMMKMPLDKAGEMKENSMNMMKMPLDKAEEMKEDAMNMMKMPLDKAGEMKENAMNMMKMPLDKAGEMKENAMNMMKMPLDKAEEMKESAMNMMKMPLDKAGEMKENAMNMMKMPLDKAEGMKEDVANMIKLPLEGGDEVKQGVGDLMKMPLEVIVAMKQASDDLMKKAESMKQEATDLKPSPMEKVEDLMKMPSEKFEEKKEEVVDLTKLHLEIFKEMKENASDSMSNIMDKISELSDAKKEQIAPMVEVISKMPTALEEMVEKLVQPKMKEDVKQMIIDLYGEDVVKELKREFKRAVGIMAAEGVKEDMKRMLTDLLANNIMEDMKADLTQAAPDLMKNSTKDMEESVKEVIIDIIEQAKDPKAKPDIPLVGKPQPIPPKDGDENMKEMLKEAMDKMEGSGPGMQEEGTEMKDLKEKMEEPASNSLPEPTPNSPPTTMGNGESNMNSSNSDAMERKIILQNQVDKEQAIAESVMRLLNMGPHRGRRHWQGGSRGFMRQGRIGNGWRWRSKRAATNRPVLRRPNLSNDVNEFPAPARLAVPMFTAYRQVNSAAPPAPYDRSKESLKLPLLSINEPATNIILDDIKAGLQYALQTRNEITIPIHGTGTTGGAALIDNLVEPGDVVLAAINGYWTELLANMSQRHDARVIRYRKPAGTRFSVKEIETALRTHRPKILLMTQGESSTTVNQPMDGIGDLCRRYGTLLVVDVVAAAGIQPVKMDQNKIDAVFTSSHKGFGGVVGLAVVSLSDRAVSKIRNRRTPPRSYQTDILSQAALVNTSADATAMRFQSISLPLLYGLREALATIAAEGIENTYRRHERATQQLDDGMTALGLQHYLTDPNLRMVGISAFRVPRGKDPLKIEQYMWRNHNIEISIGFGPTARQILRLATFASNADPAKVQNIITGLRAALNSPETNI